MNPQAKAFTRLGHKALMDSMGPDPGGYLDLLYRILMSLQGLGFLLMALLSQGGMDLSFLKEVEDES